MISDWTDTIVQHLIFIYIYETLIHLFIIFFLAPAPMSKRQRNGFYQHPPAHRSTSFSVSQDARRVIIHSEPASVHSLPSNQRIPDRNCRSESLNEHDHWADIGGLESLLNDQELKNLQADEEDNVADITVIKPVRKSVRARTKIILSPSSDNSLQDNPIKAWIPYQDQYLDVMVWHKGRRGWGNNCMRCNALDACFRCTEQECFLAGMFCHGCIVNGHRTLPLHWIEVPLNLIYCYRD